MAGYETTFQFADYPPLGNKGMVLSVKKGNKILGHLMIGKANLTWFEKNAKTKGRKVSWTELQTWMVGKKEIPASRPKD